MQIYLLKNKYYDTLSFSLFMLYRGLADERCFELLIGVKSRFRLLIHMIIRVQKLKGRRRKQSLEHSILFGKEKAC
jgi:hypothetical protein